MRALRSMGPIAAGTVVVVCEPTPLGPIAAVVLVAAGVNRDSARAGVPHRYVPLHHGGEDDAVVVDGLRAAAVVGFGVGR